MISDQEAEAVNGGRGTAVAGSGDGKRYADNIKCESCGMVTRFEVYSGTRGKCTNCGHRQSV